MFKKLLIALVAFIAVNAMADEVRYYKNDKGDKIVITFVDGNPTTASLLDWGFDGNNKMNLKANLLQYRGEIKAIRIDYSGKGDYQSIANFYIDYNNRDCLGYSGLFLTGPIDMCEFHKM